MVFEKIVLVAILLMNCCFPPLAAHSAEQHKQVQQFVNTRQMGIKSNLLYWGTTTPNFGLEMAAGNRHTAQVFFGLNPWKQSGGDHSSLRHWMVMPEYRYWFNQNFDGWFLGAHALGGQYNVGGVRFPFGLLKGLRNHRYEGWYAGGGITAGKQWILSRHWNLEASIGLGYIHTKYDKFECGTCGEKLKSAHKNYVGPTKVALSLIYLIPGRADEKRSTDAPQIIETILQPKQNSLKPVLQLQAVVAEAPKIRHLDKRAYIDFPVNKIELRADYRRNPAQLDSIITTINALKADKNLQVMAINIHGFASPEGSYKHNEYLAKNRANTLTEYVRKMVDLPDSIFTVSSTAEDWDGLREYLQQSEFEKKQQILAIAQDETLTPDARDAKMKKLYPVQYRSLLTNCYPALRHSDYHITYKIKPFDVEEAKQIMKIRPQLLSLNELFMVAQTYEVGSREFNEVMELAVRMYPEDETANLNAAIIRLNNGDAEAAKPYLDRAGDSEEADAARKAYEMMKIQ